MLRLIKDLTEATNKIRTILPQISDEAAYDALLACDEDVPRAVEYLLANTTENINKEDDRKPRLRPQPQPKSRPRTPITITAKRKNTDLIRLITRA